MFPLICLACILSKASTLQTYLQALSPGNHNPNFREASYLFCCCWVARRTLCDFQAEQYLGHWRLDLVGLSGGQTCDQVGEGTLLQASDAWLADRPGQCRV